MILTNKQEEGLRIAVQRFKDNERWTCISGYAGSGKSTLIKFIISALRVPPEEVCYVAFTGKAATVLQQKGCPNATTAHKLLYYSKPMPNGSFKFTPRSTLEGDYQVIVVDEISMLPKPMWDLLLRHNIYVIAAGDPGQLPPIDADTNNHVLDNPHVFLDEIMRQAQDSEIIRLSMWIREGKPLSAFQGNNQQVQIISKKEVVAGMYDWADQIICATNQQRNTVNYIMRQQKGFGDEPEVGDKVISLRNHWEYFSQSGNWALTNGSIGTLNYYDIQTIFVPKYISPTPLKYMFANIILEDNDYFNLAPIDYQALTTGEPCLDGRHSYLLNKNDNFPDTPFDFAYAYAITCHKAQGSEWDKVLVFEEGFPHPKDQHIKWLYTAATRAKEKLVIVKKD